MDKINIKDSLYEDFFRGMIKQYKFLLICILLLLFNSSHSQTKSYNSDSIKLIRDYKQIPCIKNKSQNAGWGRVIPALHTFQNRIYIGCGDGHNEGVPNDIISYEPVKDTFYVNYSAKTESIRKFVEYDKELFIPSTEANGRTRNILPFGLMSIKTFPPYGSIFYSDTTGTKWHDGLEIDGVPHVFDLAFFNDILYLGTGKMNGTASLYASRDKGKSFEEVFSLNTTQGFSRIYYLAATSSQLFFSGWTYTKQTPKNTQFAFIYDGQKIDTIKNVPNYGYLIPVRLNNMFTVFAFDNHPFFGGKAKNSYELNTNYLRLHDLLPDSLELGNWDIDKSDPINEKFYGIMKNRSAKSEIWWTNDFKNWYLAAKLPALENDVYTAITNLNNDIYLGTKNGNLYRLSKVP